MTMYRFILIKDDKEIMGTDVDTPTPQIDAEFWTRFMQGDCDMRFVECYEEVEENIDIDLDGGLSAINEQTKE